MEVWFSLENEQPADRQNKLEETPFVLTGLYKAEKERMKKRKKKKVLASGWGVNMPLYCFDSSKRNKQHHPTAILAFC